MSPHNENLKSILIFFKSFVLSFNYILIASNDLVTGVFSTPESKTKAPEYVILLGHV